MRGEPDAERQPRQILEEKEEDVASEDGLASTGSGAESTESAEPCRR